MPHPIYGPPRHSLEAVTLRLELPRPDNGHMSKLTIHGETSTKRGALWTYQETWLPDEQHQGLQVADAAQHVLLVSLQDHPATQEALVEQLGGAGWEDVPLPF